MMTRSILSASLLSMFATGALAAYPAGDDDIARRVLLGSAGAQTSPAGAADDSTMDAEAMFARVVERYRSLAAYEDEVHLHQVTSREGEDDAGVEARLNCSIDEGGQVQVLSPGEQSVGWSGVGSLLTLSPMLRGASREYDLWRAPHLALRVLDEPLNRFRAGIEEGFTPVKAESVMVEDEELVRVDLHSGDGLSADHRAKYEIFIHPQSLLITRIRGSETLPDGSSLHTDYTITPRRALTEKGEDVAVPPKTERTTT